MILGGQRRTNEEVREVLSEVLEDSRFGRKEPGLIEQFLEWLSEFFSGGEDMAATGLMGVELVAWLLLIVGAVLLGVFLVRHAGIAARPRGRVAPVAALQRVRDRVLELRERAREAEASGDLVLALRLYFFALVVGLGERGDLEYRDAWTNRELFERGEVDASVARELRPMLRELDAMSFGEAPVAESDVRRFDSLGARWLEGAAT